MTLDLHQKLIEEYKAEYHRTTGKLIGVTYERGWYILHHTDATDSKFRRSKLIEALNRLKLRGSSPQYTYAESIAQGCSCGC